ncbi:MAG: ABATE domain-containing protein [Pseudomonadota bacterium]
MADSAWTTETLIGGHPALDFVNTTGGRSKARDADRLADYAAFLRWSVAARLLTEAEAAALGADAAAATARAAAVLDGACAFREALHVCLTAETDSAPWPAAARHAVGDAIRAALAEATLRRTGAGYAWRCDAAALGLALPAARAALAAEDLLRSPELARLRNCHRCSWLFIDRGRGRPRRWCSMATCGSRAKSARYYRKRKGDS